MSVSWERIPVNCTCNKPLGHLIDEIESLSEAGESLEDIMNTLGIRNFCCRGNIISKEISLIGHPAPSTYRFRTDHIPQLGERTEIEVVTPNVMPSAQI